MYLRYPQSSVNWYPQSTVDRHLCWHLINISVKVNKESTNIIDIPLYVNWFIWVGLHSANSEPIVDRDVYWVSTKYWSRHLMRCQSSMDCGMLEGLKRHSTMDAISKKSEFFLSFLCIKIRFFLQIFRRYVNQVLTCLVGLALIWSIPQCSFSSWYVRARTLKSTAERHLKSPVSLANSDTVEWHTD